MIFLHSKYIYIRDKDYRKKSEVGESSMIVDICLTANDLDSAASPFTLKFFYKNCFLHRRRQRHIRFITIFQLSLERQSMLFVEVNF